MYFLKVFYDTKRQLEAKKVDAWKNFWNFLYSLAIICHF